MKIEKLYRPDIDGLRTIAVFSVVLYHAFSNFIRGGFVGVDVFFVISGYLITGILLDELQRRKFSIIGFYKRRIARLFPALLTVLIVSYAFCYYILVESEFKQFNKHILGGATFISNLILWAESGYFDTSSLTKPLLHLWSLGVEEQYYIFIPLFLYFMWKRDFNIIYGLCILIAISLIYNIITLMGDPTAAFYNPLGRFWELLVGSLLAVLSFRNKLDKISGAGYSLFGLALIGFSVFFYDKFIAFPGGQPFYPSWARFLSLGRGRIMLLTNISWAIKLWCGLG